MTALNQRNISVSHLGQWALRGRLFAILDATDTPSVPRRAAELGESRAISLYRGRAEEEWSSIAPFLVQVDAHTLDWITGELWPEPWGIFVLADVPIETLRTHFRNFLVVESPDGDSWYFRFYDPRVLTTYLSTCTPLELAAFFGPALGYGTTDLASYGVIVQTLGTAVPVRAAPAPNIAIRI